MLTGRHERGTGQAAWESTSEGELSRTDQAGFQCPAVQIEERSGKRDGDVVTRDPSTIGILLTQARGPS